MNKNGGEFINRFLEIIFMGQGSGGRGISISYSLSLDWKGLKVEYGTESGPSLAQMAVKLRVSHGLKQRDRR